jgi:outer membrane lipoprotein-sorting protein
MSRKGLVILWCVVACGGAAGGNGSGDVSAVLSSMDAAAASFRSMTASISRVSYTAIINDKTEESGSIRVLKTSRGASMLVEFEGPDRKAIAFSDRKAEIYYPKIPSVDEYDLGKHKNLVDQYLLLGFGTSGRDVTRGYTVRLVGEEQVEGRKTWHLELTPKAREVAESMKAAELWIANPGGYAVQQKFLERSGNYTLVTYTNINMNAPVTPESLRLNVPPGVKRQYPMK